MNINFETLEQVNGKMTLIVEEADYKDNVEKKLKDYRRKAEIRGYRKGNAPMPLIRKMYEQAVKMDEINQSVGRAIYSYLQENNIKMLGEPLPADEQQEQDLEGPAPYTFVFDIAISPEVEIKLSKRDQVPYYRIKVDDKLIDQQAEQIQRQNGHYENAEQYDAEQRDILRGTLTELDAEGNEKAEGIRVEEAMVMPAYISDEEQKGRFDEAKKEKTIVFNPKKAYKDNASEVAALLKIKKEEAETIEADFSFRIGEISRFVAAKADTELFDKLFGEGNVKTEEEYRARIAEQMATQLEADSQYRLSIDMRRHVEKKAGKIQLPEELLKRVMIKNNKEREADYVEKNFEGSINALRWYVIKEKLTEMYSLKLETEEITATARAMARNQFAQYGMNNVPEEYINKYADDMLKKEDNLRGIIDNATETKLINHLKTVVKLVEKDVTFDEFNKLFEE